MLQIQYLKRKRKTNVVCEMWIVNIFGSGLVHRNTTAVYHFRWFFYSNRFSFVTKRLTQRTKMNWIRDRSPFKYLLALNAYVYIPCSHYFSDPSFVFYTHFPFSCGYLTLHMFRLLMHNAPKTNLKGIFRCKSSTHAHI